jgi:hypothetical protein
MLFKRGFLSRVNTKKKTGYLSISPNRTLYITFMLSLIFHAGLIYTVPSVTLFSEGLGEPASDPIVVDFIQENSAEIPSEIPQATDDQFLASPPTKSERTPEETPSQPVGEPVIHPNEIEIPTPPPIDKSIKTEAPYTLLANSDAPDQEIEHLRKHLVEKRDTPIPQTIPELPKPEKLSVQPEQPQPVEIPRAAVNKKPAISVVKNSQEKNTSEETLDFPLDIYEKQQPTTSI